MQEDSSKVSAPAAAGGRKPVILAVDDEPQVLNAVALDLRRRFRGDYRIMTAASGAEALDAVRKLRQRGDLVALFLVDQRMPGMTGAEFLDEARKLHPQANKVLLTAYADTEAAIASINEVGLDHYLMKPWHPPEQKLYPVLDDLLTHGPRTSGPRDGIRVVGALWSPQSHDAKDFLSRNQVPYQWIDVDRTGGARAGRAVAGEGQAAAAALPRRHPLSAPTRRELAEKVGLQTQAAQPFYDLVVMGGGPAGLAAAVYGASEGLKTLLIEQEAPGGQAGTSSRIENYLGFPTASRAPISRSARRRRRAASAPSCWRAGVVSSASTTRTALSCSPTAPRSSATRSSSRRASRCAARGPGRRALMGAGVYYGAAMTEAATTATRRHVVGGANSAGQGALFFSRYARNVTMLVRGPALASRCRTTSWIESRPRPTSRSRPRRRSLEVKGDRSARGLRRRAPATARPGRLRAAAVFVFIGARPRTEFCEGVLARDPAASSDGPRSRADGQGPPGGRRAACPRCSRPASPAFSRRATSATARRSASPPPSARARWRSAYPPVLSRRCNAMGYADFLRRVPLFAELPDADLERLCSMIRR